MINPIKDKYNFNRVERGGTRVERGGNWSNSPHFLQPWYRFNYFPARRNYYFGFRIVRNKQ